MNPEHIEFFGNAIDRTAGDFFYDADAMVWIYDLLSHSKFHKTSGKHSL